VEVGDPFSKEGPDEGKVGYINSDRGFAGVPKHVRCIVDIREVEDFRKNGSGDLGKACVSM
jgi:hypothetical protein